MNPPATSGIRNPGTAAGAAAASPSLPPVRPRWSPFLHACILLLSTALLPGAVPPNPPAKAGEAARAKAADALARGDLPQARAHLEDALSAADVLGDLPAQDDILTRLADLETRAGRPAAGRDRLTRLLALAHAADDLPRAFRTLLLRAQSWSGECLFRESQEDLAVAARTLDGCPAEAAAAGRIELAIARGRLAFRSGRDAACLEELAPAVAEARRTGRTAPLWQALILQAEAQAGLAREREWRESLQEAAAAARSIPDLFLEAAVHKQRARRLQEWGRTEEAVAALRRALELLEKSGDRPAALDARLDLAAALDRNSPDEAEALLQKAASAEVGFPKNDAGSARRSAARARSHLDHGRIAEALATTRQALENILPGSFPRERAALLLIRAEVHSRQGLNAEAAADCEAARTAALAAGLPHEAARASLALGRCADEGKDWKAAILAFLNAADYAELHAPDDGDLEQGPSRPLACDTAREIYRRGSAALLALGRPAEAWRVFERSRAFLLREAVRREHRCHPEGLAAAEADEWNRVEARSRRLQIQGLQPFADPAERKRAQRETRELAAAWKTLRTRIESTRPGFVAARDPVPPGLEELKSRLGADTAILGFQGGAPHSALYVLTAAGLRAYRLPGVEDLGAAVDGMVALLQTLPSEGTVHSGWAARSHGLFRKILLAPRWSEFPDPAPPAAEGDTPWSLLRTIPHWVLIGEDPLQRLPWDALLASPAPAGAGYAELDYLAAHAATLRAPSAGVWAALTPAPTAPFAASRNNRLVWGDDRAGPGLLPRPEVFPAGSVFTAGSPGAILATLSAGAGSAPAPLSAWRVLEIACPAHWDRRNPSHSRIDIAPAGAPAADPEPFLPSRIAALRLNADLVALTACRIPLLGSRDDEGLLGFSHLFLEAGARRVLSSQWDVDPEVRTAMWARFYRGWVVDGQPPPEALRRAREVQWKAEKHNTPADWAGLILEGGSP